MWGTLLELLFPKSCCACGARPVGGAFCGDCSILVEALPAWRCSRCAGPVAPPGAGARVQGRVGCGSCVAAPPAFAEVLAPLVYGGAIADAVHRLKYRGRREVARGLASLVAVPYGRALRGVDLVVPIPLHPTRRRQRGYDQAELLAREIARSAGVSFDGRLLRRVRDTPRQVGRSREERAQNLVGAFEAGGRVEGLKIAVVDDVVTTGATAAAAAEALVLAGASRVSVLAVARAM